MTATIPPAIDLPIEGPPTDDSQCDDCGGNGWHCVDRCYGNEHWTEERECESCPRSVGYSSEGPGDE